MILPENPAQIINEEKKICPPGLNGFKRVAAEGRGVCVSIMLYMALLLTERWISADMAYYWQMLPK